RTQDRQREVASVRAALIRLESRWRHRLAPGNPPGLNDETSAAFAKVEGDRSPREVELVFEALARDRRIKPGVWAIVLDPAEWSARQMLLVRLARMLYAPGAELAKARGIDEAGSVAPATYLRIRGEFSARGPEVQPSFPAALCASRSAADVRPKALARSSGRRSALAEWLVRPDHPLLARVMVNRLWQHHFGRGLVGTPSDFGTMGEEPSNPELLDWLATELIRRGWSLKSMHRLIVTSATYRQSSRSTREGREADPDNLLWWHQNRPRLDGSAIRGTLPARSTGANARQGGRTSLRAP